MAHISDDYRAPYKLDPLEAITVLNSMDEVAAQMPDEDLRADIRRVLAQVHRVRDLREAMTRHHIGSLQRRDAQSFDRQADGYSKQIHGVLKVAAGTPSHPLRAEATA